MKHDLPDLAELWQEQVDPAEQAKLQTLAGQIKTRTRLNRAWDFALGFLALALAIWALPSLEWQAPVVLLVGWALWRRHRISAAALALDEGDQDAFLAAAIANARAELSFSTKGLYIAPVGFLLGLVPVALDGHLFDQALGLVLLKAFACLIVFSVIWGFFVRGNRRWRERLRRLEAMAEEYEAEKWRDLNEDA